VQWEKTRQLALQVQAPVWTWWVRSTVRPGARKTLCEFWRFLSVTGLAEVTSSGFEKAAVLAFCDRMRVALAELRSLPASSMKSAMIEFAMGATPAIVAAMRTHELDEAVQTAAANALFQLWCMENVLDGSTDFACRQAIIRSGGVEAVRAAGERFGGSLRCYPRCNAPCRHDLTCDWFGLSCW
jgi:hypothetical protein